MTKKTRTLRASRHPEQPYKKMKPKVGFKTEAGAEQGLQMIASKKTAGDWNLDHESRVAIAGAVRRFAVKAKNKELVARADTALLALRKEKK